MNAVPPPIQEPWKLDQQGRLISPAWVLWLRSLSDSGSVADLFSDNLPLQSTESTSTIQPETASSESATQIEMLPPQSSTTLTSDDALLFCWLNY